MRRGKIYIYLFSPTHSHFIFYVLRERETKRIFTHTSVWWSSGPYNTHSLNNPAPPHQAAPALYLDGQLTAGLVSVCFGLDGMGWMVWYGWYGDRIGQCEQCLRLFVPSVFIISLVLFHYHCPFFRANFSAFRSYVHVFLLRAFVYYRYTTNFEIQIQPDGLAHACGRRICISLS